MGKKLSLSIQDSGSGIPENIIKQIFKSGYSNKPGRQGVGLTAAQILVREHFKGTIEAVPGTAGVVNIIIPLA
jgi:sensor histidine kinase regulating citrate/malate metabolism